MKQVKESQEVRENFEESIRVILDREEKGFIVVFGKKETWDFAYECNIVECRDALLSYAREIAAYPGDDEEEELSWEEKKDRDIAQ